MTSLVGSSVRMSLCSAARRWGAGVGRLGTMSYGTTASTMPFSETQRHACMFTGASRPFPSPSLGAAACPGSNTAVRRFSSVGMGGSRGGGSMVDITAGSLPGDDENFPRLSVRGFGENVFQVNETLVHGSVLLLPKTYYCWEATKFQDITIESLTVFTLIYPTIEVLFVGCGDTMPGQLDPALLRFFKQKGIVIELSNSANAAATYNVLNSEGRNVAAALLALGPQEGRAKRNR